MAMRMAGGNKPGFLTNFKEGWHDAFGEGREDQIKIMHDARGARNQDNEAPRAQRLVATNRTLTLLNDLLGISNKEDREARIAAGMGLKDTLGGKLGQIGGVLSADLTQDRSREAWWLINAPQAVVNVAQEGVLSKVAPDLFGTTQVMRDIPEVRTPGGRILTPAQKRGLTDTAEDREWAQDNGILDAQGRPKRRYSIKKGKVGEVGEIRERNYAPGYVDSLMIPSGIAVNAGIGLLNPFGGSEGYDAVLPDEEDPNKTKNVIAEVGAKYILGRTGNLSKWDEFKEERPDVSKGEYNAYKAFKWDKNTDLDLSDGDFTALLGVIKGTDEGIHGPELQFLGRSLPVNTALMPIASTIAGTALGAMHGGKRGLRHKDRIRNSFVGGMTALGSSSLAGNMVEQERRRRNMENNGNEDPMYSN